MVSERGELSKQPAGAGRAFRRKVVGAFKNLYAQKRIIPCLDVKDGRVVKGVNFVQLRDAGDPVSVAEAYDQQGADEIVFLDITASHEKRGIMIEIVKHTAEKVLCL